MKNKYPKYYSFQGRKISKKISLPKKKLINKFYNDFSVDQDVIECLNNDKINRKIDIPDRYDITNIVKNIILSNLNSFYFLEAMPDKSIDKIFLINPDPWIKKRHHKRRLMSYEILSLLNKITKSKNSIYMTTDSHDYFRDTVSLLNEYKDSFGTFSSSILKKNDELYGISKYQRKAIENGGKIYQLTL